MIRNARFPENDDDEIPAELADLGKRIEALSGSERSELLLAHQRVVDSVRRRRRILSLVQEALSQLRLDIKYLMFDLEVTRQERDELKQQLEDRWTRGNAPWCVWKSEDHAPPKVRRRAAPRKERTVNDHA